MADYVRTHSTGQFSVGLILGTGLGSLAESIKNPKFIQYSDIPNFAPATCTGHVGRFVCGELEGHSVICMQGRLHTFEGYSLQRITACVRMMHALGVRRLIVTNAAGGMNMEYRMGDFMILKDHIYLPGFVNNPLIGPNEPKFGERFVIMDTVYDKDLRRIARHTAYKQGIIDHVREGVYFMINGPMFCTNAEIGVVQKLGADAIGMSTCPEVCVAAHCGIRVLAISVITDAVAQYNECPVNHELVMREGEKASARLCDYVKGILHGFSEADESEQVVNGVGLTD